jgi:hypothetical protein
MTRGTIAIREVKANADPLSLEDFSYRQAGKRIAEAYVKKNYEENDMPQWMWSALYFFLGCFFWESIPAFVELGRFFIKL